MMHVYHMHHKTKQKEGLWFILRWTQGRSRRALQWGGTGFIKKPSPGFLASSLMQDTPVSSAHPQSPLPEVTSVSQPYRATVLVLKEMTYLPPLLHKNLTPQIVINSHQSATRSIFSNGHALTLWVTQPTKLKSETCRLEQTKSYKSVRMLFKRRRCNFTYLWL